MAGLALTGLMKFFDHDNKYSDKLVGPLAKTMVPKDTKDRTERTKKSSRDHVDDYPRSREERRRSIGGRDFDRMPPSRDHEGGRRRHRSRSHERLHRHHDPRRAATFDDRYHDHRPEREYRNRPGEESDRRGPYHQEHRRQSEPRHRYLPPPPRAGPPRDTYRRAGPPPDDRRSSSIYGTRSTR